MAGYTQKWCCRICEALQDSDGIPSTQVCETCIVPLASKLLKEKFPTATILDAGIDTDYWMNRAWEYAATLLRNWAPRA